MYHIGSESHLVCPEGPEERELTIPDFYPSNGQIYPDQFIRVLPFIEANFKTYAQADTLAQTLANHGNKLRIGNAVDMTEWMISNSANPVKRDELEKHIFANWNLDADRGYAYKTWSGNIPSESDPNVLVNEHYV
jgi:hypothetical protein